MSDQSARYPACKKATDRIRVVKLLADATAESGRESVVALLAGPHCAITISAQLLGAIG